MNRRTGGVSRQLARCLAVALIFGWATFCLVVAATAADKPARHTIIIEGVAYQPATMLVKRGDTVVWINRDPFPHTVTAPGAFDSHDIAAGASWSYIARKTGIYSYFCSLHPTMKATLRVSMFL